ncbi:MAG: hypothetical protein KG075_09580 [Alphaproteobacteria bacterium]|nr:hypothetical protein [Alphaproteobacteria bacterium]
MVQEKIELAKQMLDALSITALLAVFFQWLPHATALLSFIWVCIRLYETKTVQRWLGRR